MYADSRHLLQKFEVGIIAFGAIALFRESGRNMDAWKWLLQPKHIGYDFAPLLAELQQAFQALVQCHTCYLFRRVRALITQASENMIRNVRLQSQPWTALSHGFGHNTMSRCTHHTLTLLTDTMLILQSCQSMIELVPPDPTTDDTLPPLADPPQSDTGATTLTANPPLDPHAPCMRLLPAEY